jgi:hypothetical protein
MGTASAVSRMPEFIIEYGQIVVNRIHADRLRIDIGVRHHADAGMFHSREYRARQAGGVRADTGSWPPSPLPAGPRPWSIWGFS